LAIIVRKVLRLEVYENEDIAYDFPDIRPQKHEEGQYYVNIRRSM
jgi:hypothetical protein